MTTFSNRLAELSVFFLDHPELPEPHISGNLVSFQAVDPETYQSNATLVHALALAIGGNWQKNDPKVSEYESNYYRLTREQKVGGFRIEVWALRSQICERVVTGTKQVTLPAVEAREERVIEEPVFEWQCIPLNRNADELA